jgi:hypothetical protein
MKKNILCLLLCLLARTLYAFSLFTGMSQFPGKIEQETLKSFASTSYRQGDRERAKDYLNRLLKSHPNDSYANRFLGVLFLMDGNTEAALKYWNRVGEPRIKKISFKPSPDIDAILMDRAFVMAPASPLLLQEYRETKSRLEMMGAFKEFEFQLRPHQESRTFDLILRPQLRKGTFASKINIAAMVAQGALTDSIEPSFHNIGSRTMHSTSFISWDEYRNRIYTSLSLPLGDEPHARLRVFADHRAETWDIGSDMELRKWETGFEAAKTWNDRISWSSGIKVSYRTYNGVQTDRSVFQEGALVGVFGGVDFSIVRIPEKRLSLKGKSLIGTGKFIGANDRPSFVNFEHSLHLTWFPHPADEDLATNANVHFGRALGSAPFDEFYSLGADRNMNLRLRAHRSEMDQYGENPFGPGYLLFNWDISKTIFENGKFRWRLVPFVDTARISPGDLWKGPKWFLDTGLQSGFQVFDSIELMMTYGKDLQSGRNVIYLGLHL